MTRLAKRPRAERKKAASTNPYEILGVERWADHEMIEKAYRLRARETHPDKNPGESDDEFKRVVWAYEILSDPSRRQMFDLTGSTEPEKTDSRLAEVMCVLSRCFAALFDMNPEMAEHFDFVKAMRDSIRSAVAKMERELDGQERAIEKLTKVAGRFNNKKNGGNVMSAMVMQVANNVRFAVHQARLSIKVHHEALAMLDEHGYDFIQHAGGQFRSMWLGGFVTG